MIAEIRSRPTVSRIPEIQERSVIGVTPFDWRRDYATTWRECPSAFWLAPDAADTLPAADLVHPRIAEPESPEKAVQDDAGPLGVDGRAAGIASAMLAAGPIFAAALSALTAMPGQGLAMSAVSLMLFPFTVLFGVLLAVLPVTAGTVAVGWLGERWRFWQRPFVWALTGALSGAALAAPFGEMDGVAAMTITGAACALLARWRVEWLPRAQSEARSVATPAVAISACPAK